MKNKMLEPITVYCVKVVSKRRRPEINIEISQEGKETAWL